MIDGPREDDAFAAAAEAHRRELRAHCYRMLGSMADADDAVQETLLRGWRGIDRFEGRSSLRSWLYTIATNVCLRALERRPRRALPMDLGPAADPGVPFAPPGEAAWVDPYTGGVGGLPEGLAGPEARYEQREAVELAFVAALQHLPARQRAVLVLRDVLGFSARETAEALDTSPAGVDSALQRAHRTVDGRLPERSQQAVVRSLGDEELRRMVDRFVAAWERADVEEVVSLLTSDGVVAMPPQREWLRGREAAAAFFSAGPLSAAGRWRLLPTEANGQPAVAKYRWDPARGAFVAHNLGVLTLHGSLIDDFTSFIEPRHVLGLGLPAEIALA